MRCHSLKAAAKDFLTLATAGKVSEAAERGAGNGFRHHSPYSSPRVRAHKRGRRLKTTGVLP